MFHRGDRVACRDGILDQWRFGIVTDIDGHHYRVRFRGDTTHPKQNQWVSANRLVAQSMVGDAIEDLPGFIQFFVDQFKRYRHVMNSKSDCPRTTEQRKRVRFRPGNEFKQTLLLSPNSCFKRSNEELSEMYRLQDVRRGDELRARQLMKDQRAQRTFLNSDYTRYIKEDEDVDDHNDANLPISVSMSNNFQRNNFRWRDDDVDDGDDAMAPIASNQN